METPIKRPGILRFSASVQAMNAGVRSAESHRHAEALGRADADISAESPGSFEHGEREQVRRHDGDRTGGFGFGEETP